MGGRLTARLLLVALVSCEARPEAAVQSAASAPALEGTSEPTSQLGAVPASAASVGAAASAVPAGAAPVVDLAGRYRPPPPPPPGAEVLGAIDWVVRVRERPDSAARELGYLRAGAMVSARAGEHGPSRGCRQGWRAVEPAGWVCMDGMTTDREHEVLRAAARRPDFAHRLPYMYGTVTRGGPVYARVPRAEDLKAHEPHLDEHLAKWRRDEVSGARYGLDVWLRYTEGRNVPGALEALEAKVTDPDIPWFVADHRRVPAISKVVKSAPEDAVRVDEVKRRQGRSFVHSFLMEGRRYNVTPDLVVIPADRFRPIRGSAFHGWQVGKEIQLPLALIRRPGAKAYRFDGERRVEAGTVPWRSAHELTGKQRMFDDVLHYETRAGTWLDDRHASRVDPAKRWPKWAKQGAKWIDVNITGQYLVAYEGQNMVYATLVSTGEAGLDDSEGSTATKRGIFRIHAKYVTVTMDSDEVGEEFELRDVPYVQYFEGGYALHGAYWHDRFGRPKSHGCINLAPEDARRLFFWTDPPVPAGWQGARDPRTGTIVFVHP